MSEALPTTANAGGDRLIAVLLLVLETALAIVYGFVGLMLLFLSDSCNDGTCNDGLIGLGMGITGLVPLVVLVIAVVHVIVRLRRDERVWWVPLMWIAISTAIAASGIVVAFSGASNGTF